MRPPSGGALAIKLTDLYKAFGSQTVLEGVNLQVLAGETLVVLGRSGTGKSVLLRLLIGLQPPDSGSIEVLGQEITGLGEDRLYKVRRKVGFVFQNSALYDSLTVLENVAFPLKYLRRMPARERRDRTMELLSQVGMETSAGKMPTDLSGGMRKRVGLARALALEPDLMLYDEPTAGLDPITSGEINELILRLKQDRAMTSIVVTHEIHSAEVIADRVALLNLGRIVFDGTFQALKDSNDPFVSLFVRTG
jgi:phospholipid/cholesterol/gamma-HCH transport system ATP-binding protein